ncbi:DEAD/DEAH box helicase [Halobellus ruber]|uniref:DEAD/DEAH box helicase n=1 Tax=Halobellus ruber TaxID=2761102 RepID=A0A7J9SLL4_9EURY|nr:DEAD/DEAH box helicase [Halobellus ruber]MBB6647854.1 DEAD/DEAH box helicase [Halobellus ruber]
MSTGAASVDLETIDRAWETFVNVDSVYEDVEDTVLEAVTEVCQQEINAGNYDATAALDGVYAAFENDHLGGDSTFVTEVLRSDELVVDTMEMGEERIARELFHRLIEHLVDDGQLLYVGTRQEVRSHVAEMARYFALVRQRLTDETDYQFTPNLVKMIKMASADRKQPIMGRDEPEAARFRQPIRKINERVTEDSTEPAWELDDTVGSEWRDVVGETMETMSDFFDNGLPDDFDSLAAFQARAFRDLYLDAMTKHAGDTTSHVVTASTGGGKTEAFLFPTLAYCLTAAKANISGNKALLTYPRRDLCNNQFERAFEYITELNRIEDSLDASFEDAPLTISIQHSSRRSLTLDCPHCDGELSVPEEYKKKNFECDNDASHTVEYATVDRSAAADVIVTTQNSLHRRMMDNYGREALWKSPYPTKFLVLDEVHIYTDQAGMNVSNVVRRFKQGLRRTAPQQQPTLVASSATINNAEDFTRRIFDTEDAVRICPTPDEQDTLSREHFVFVKATDPREVRVPLGESMYKPENEWDDVSQSTATNLSCMIQVAFAFFHTMRKERAGDRDGLEADKNRILGFVDSIDSVSRLGGYVQEAEDNELFKFRMPDALLGERGNNPDCPRDLFRGATDDQFDEAAICESQPPNPNVNPCPVYQDGECWWTMQDRAMDLKDMTVAIHKSGSTRYAGSDHYAGDDWDQLITTSALEVGFDHASIIGTFQYRAPRNVPGFLQRKGRGGRDANDEPITVVVLGSTPTDSYYFHHSNYLSDPRDKHLRIPLDENNRFIRAEHMTASVLDYFNVANTVDAQRLFSGTRSTTGPDIDYLRQMFDDHRTQLEQWLSDTYNVDSEEVETVLSQFDSYLDCLDEKILPDSGEVYWEFFARMVEEDGQKALDEIDMLLRKVDDR